MTAGMSAAIVILALPAATAALLAAAALLSAFGRDQRRFRLRHLPRRRLAARRRSAAERLHSRRRSQRRLHRAQHVRRLYRERVQRDLYRPRDRDRAPDAYASAFLSRDVSVSPVFDEPRADRQQYRTDVGGDRVRHADDGADGRHLSHARRRSRRRGNISFSAASASRSPSSARSSSTWPPGRSSAKASRGCCGRA